ncbi:MAG: hypothetical protein QW343_01790 [Candidatus Norongarragalinales archaeon]
MVFSTLKKQFKEFLSKPFNKWLVIALLVLGVALLAFDAAQQTASFQRAQNASSEIIVHFFFLPTCPHCNEQKPFNAQLQAEYPEAKWVYHDVSNPEEAALLAKMAEQHGLDTSKLGVPATFFKSKVIVGFDKPETTGVKLREALEDCIAECKAAGGATPSSVEKEYAPTEIDLPFFGKIRIADYSLPVLAVVLGIVDGFNPCAMWVLVYLIALVMELNDRRRVWLIVGSFVLASGVLYFLFMTAWLNAFLAIGFFRPVTILVGLFALGAGITGVKEYWEMRGKAIVCKVGNEEEKAKTMNRVKELVSAPLTWATLAGIVALAFVVNSIEFVCSSAIPAVFTQVLALARLEWWQHYAYIALYDFFFMLDDLIIFGLAAFAVTRYGVGEKYAKQCKLIGGAVMLVLGAMMLFAPQLLR